MFSMVCHLTKMAHFVPYHKEITAEESADLIFSVIIIDYMGSLKVLYLIEILSLSGSSGRPLWES